MIKGIVGYKVLRYKDLEPILMKQNWKSWTQSKVTQDLLEQAKAVVIGVARLTAYRTMPTVEWR